MSDSSQPSHFADIDSESYREHFQPGDHILAMCANRMSGRKAVSPARSTSRSTTCRIAWATSQTISTVVLVCAAGARSMTGAQFLLQSGYLEVYNLADGTIGWIKKGFPIET